MFTRTLLITGSTGLLGAATLKSIREDRRFEDFNVLTPTRSQLNLFSEGETYDYFEKNRPEVVIHLAAKVMGLAGNLNNQISALDENSRIDQNVLRACLKFQPRKFSMPAPRPRMVTLILSCLFLKRFSLRGKFTEESLGMRLRSAWHFPTSNF